MPLYDFKCSVCSQIREYLVKIDALPVECKTCSSPKSTFIKQTSKPGTFIFKGTGFYATDSKASINNRDKLSPSDRKILYGDN